MLRPHKENPFILYSFSVFGYSFDGKYFIIKEHENFKRKGLSKILEVDLIQ